MREKKFANILDDYPLEVANEIKEETQEKLSMTRELKFKELQEKIDKDEVEDVTLEKEVTTEVKIEEVVTDKVEENLDEEEVTVELSKKELKEMAKKEKKEQKAMQDDLYLTSSFKPLRKRFKLSRLFKVIFSLLLVIGILGALGYFVIWPLYNKYMDSKPKAIFENVIDYVADSAYNAIDSNWSYTDDFSYLDLGIKFESLEDVDYANTYYGFAFGFNETQAKEYIYIKDPDSNEEYGVSMLIDGDMGYYKSTHSDTYYGMESDSDVYTGLYDSEGESVSISKEEVKYFLDKERNAFKQLLLDEYIEAEQDEIEIDGKTIDVTRNSYTLNGEELEEIYDKYNDILLKDEKYLKIYAKFIDSTVEEVKEYYTDDDLEVEDDYTLSINIYTVKGNKVVGFDVEENGFRVLYLYFNEDEFDFHMNFTEDEECLEGKDCVAENMMVLDLKGTYKDDYTEVVVEYNEIEVATLDIRELSFEKIDLDYDIEYMDFEVEGTLVLDLNTDTHEYSAELLFDYDGVEMTINVFMNFDDEFKLEEINPDDVQEYTDDKVSKDLENLYVILDEKGMLEEFEMWFDMFMNYASTSGPSGDLGIIM